MDRDERLDTLLDDRDELEKLLRLCLELTDERELLRLRLLLSFSRDIREADLDLVRDFFDSDRLLDFFESERLRDFFDSDLLLDFFDTERLLDRLDIERVLLLDRDFSGECDGDFFDRDGDLEVECFDSEEDRDLEDRVGLIGDFEDFFAFGFSGDTERTCLGDVDFLLLEWERDFLSLDCDLGDRCLGDLEDLLSIDVDLV